MVLHGKGMITSAIGENNWHTWKRLWLGQKSSTLQDLSRLYLWHTWMRWLRGTSWYFIIHNHNHWLCAIFKRWTSIVQLDPQVVENYWAAGATSRSLVIATFATAVCLQVGVALHMWRGTEYSHIILRLPGNELCRNLHLHVCTCEVKLIVPGFLTRIYKNDESTLHNIFSRSYQSQYWNELVTNIEVKQI